MKKIISFNLVLAFIIGLLPLNTVSAKNDSGYYVVTAYYSPLPNQEKYLTGDYESEKRLNWQWIAWASWKSVYSWMLAAPKTYNFGTKIYLEWLGIGSVEDRWWAIVQAWVRWYNHDRIDVWMWYWDEWLQRALYWGKRTVKWYVVDKNSKTTIDYNNVLSPKWATSWLEKKNDIFDYSLWVWSDINKVKKLQSFFKDLWFYSWNIDWNYNDEIIDIVFDFQLSNQIINNKYDLWAGYWWVKTRWLFKKMYFNWDFDKKETKKILEKKEDSKDENKSVVDKKEIKEEKSNINSDSSDFDSKADDYIKSISYDKTIFDSFVDTKWKVKVLQNIMYEMWLYKWDISGDYDDLIDPIYYYQIDNNIVSNESSPWAWYFWPKTRASIKNTYNDYLENIKKEKIKEYEEKYKIEQEKLKEKKRKQELEQKYKELEKYAEKAANERIQSIWNLREWSVSVKVRELQLTLKELGYFDYDDTAIFWDITKKSVIAFQIDNDVVSTSNDVWAGIVWPKTLNAIKNNIKSSLLKQKIKNEHSDLLEVASIDLSI